MENEEISDTQISASSQLDENNAAVQARLNLKEDGNKQGGWSALINDFNQWLRVDLGRYTTVTRVATQGKSGHDQWVSRYRFQYSDDGMTFTYVKKTENSSAKVYLFPYVLYPRDSALTCNVCDWSNIIIKALVCKETVLGKSETRHFGSTQFINPNFRNLMYGFLSDNFQHNIQLRPAFKNLSCQN